MSQEHFLQLQHQQQLLCLVLLLALLLLLLPNYLPASPRPYSAPLLLKLHLLVMALLLLLLLELVQVLVMCHPPFLLPRSYLQQQLQQQCFHLLLLFHLLAVPPLLLPRPHLLRSHPQCPTLQQRMVEQCVMRRLQRLPEPQ